MKNSLNSVGTCLKVVDTRRLDSTTVGRYRSLLVKNDFLERRLALLPSPVLRKILISGILGLCVVLLYFVAVEQGLSRFFYLAVAAAILMECLLRFKRERVCWLSLKWRGDVFR